MKKLLLFILLPFLGFAQINIDKVCSFTQEEARNYADEIVYINKGEASQIKTVKKTIAGLKPWISYKELNSAKVR